MYYVYLLRSINNPQKSYIGYTLNLKNRIEKHNNGGSVHTSDNRPWKLVAFLGFDTKAKALDFEKYLKTGSGHTFAQRRFW